MSTLEDKLEEIEAKVTKLLDQNIQYKRICEDLLATRRILESENKELNLMLDSMLAEIEVIDSNIQNISTSLGQEEENSKDRINDYIQDITNSINRLK